MDDEDVIYNILQPITSIGDDSTVYNNGYNLFSDIGSGLANP